MKRPSAEWFQRNLDLLARFQFNNNDFSELSGRFARFMTWDAIANLRGPVVGIPIDSPQSGDRMTKRFVRFSGTQLTLWNSVPAPAPDWHPIPNSENPLWWQHETSSLTPAWTLWANLAGLMASEEDQTIAIRDRHGRLPLRETPRFKAGLHTVPAVNEAMAALLDAFYALRDGMAPALALPADCSKLTILLSHDCDVLTGNDLLTQSVRLLRAARAAGRADFPEAARRLRAILENAIFPGRYYLKNLLDMIECEHQRGYRSICYILNGSRGRFGTRDNPRQIQKLTRALRPGWELGLHYNYNTFENAEKFSAQKREFSEITGRTPIAGRAHYLRFDPLTSPRFLQTQGIFLDESSGWIEELSFRNGIAGPFRPFDGVNGQELDLIEVPMLITDNSLRQDGQLEAAQKLFTHLSKIGGMVTGLFHPGASDNPEEPNSAGAYARLLDLAVAAGASCLTPSEILAKTASFA